MQEIDTCANGNRTKVSPHPTVIYPTEAGENVPKSSSSGEGSVSPVIVGKEPPLIRRGQGADYEI